MVKNAISSLPHGIPTTTKPLRRQTKSAVVKAISQICFLNAAAGKALTTFLAGLAATFTSLPKMFLTPALVAGLVLVLIRHKPGIAKTPVFFTSFVAMATKLLITSEQVLGFKSFSLAIAFSKAPLVMAFAAAAFIDFIGGNMVRGRLGSNRLSGRIRTARS